MLKELSVSILAATTLFSASSGAVLAEPLQASAVEAKAGSQAAERVLAKIVWNDVPGAAWYEISIRNLDTDRQYFNRENNDNKHLTYVDSGHKYRFWVGAFDKNGKLIKQDSTTKRINDDSWISLEL
ncbi:hypothetical protein ABEW50_00070 [Paenibacillus jamilae]|uniref:Uncharacterized protein n=1 Tax=Paenibacillus alvei TaxID=44250 RepID=A0ABT4EC28_PAEAL|nr:hypothetical protein [Paenibacillus alvei]MCY9530043.1 hypothetical protein [Paenibacillus alvei]